MKPPHDFEPLNILLSQWLNRREQNPKQDAHFLPQNLSAVWAHIVGQTVARYAHPVQLVGHTLGVEVSSEAWSQALIEQRPFLLHQLKAQLPQLSIRDIQFFAQSRS